jgi:hypothetical protein
MDREGRTVSSDDDRSLGPLDRRFEERIARLSRRSTRCFRWRVALFVLFIGILPLPVSGGVRIALLTIVAAAFVAVAVVHRRIDHGIERARAWLRLQREQQARRELNWDGLPPAAPGLFPPHHPFAGDLDLEGPASLHRLLDFTVSLRGSALLASWLGNGSPEVGDVIPRQRLVRALVPARHFREHLRLEFDLVSRDKLDGDAFLAWLRTARIPPVIRVLLPLMSVLAAVNLLLFAGWGMGQLGPWFLLGVFIYSALYFRFAGVREAFLAAAVRLDDELGRLKTVFRFLEEYRYGASEELRSLVAPFLDPRDRPSRHIRRVLRDVVAAGLTMNPVMMVLLNLPLPWDFLFAARLERERARLERLLPGWLDALQRLEALQSLANFGWLHPQYSFPDIVEEHGSATRDNTDAGTVEPVGHPDDDMPLLAAVAMGHPLIPHVSRVSNDFSIDRIGRVYLVTGSNMSGKSTFLRTVGVNLVLAYAGGPVAARALRTRIFRVQSCIQISDSLREGVSYFYAEVRRLRELLEATKRPDGRPVLFLIDEIFKGTNNIERNIGAAAYVEALAGGGGCGMVSTHDIDLTRLADTLPDVVNLHFREHVVDDRMVFDYVLREGPCPTTNALTIMRLEGLPVPDHENGRGRGRE